MRAMMSTLRPSLVRVSYLLAVALLLATLPATSVLGAQKDDPFKTGIPAIDQPDKSKKKAEDDPFDPVNRAQPKPPVKQVKEDPIDERIGFEFKLEPQKVRPGQAARLTIIGIPKPGYHTYPITKRSSNPKMTEDFLSQIKFPNTPPGLKPLWPVEESEPEFVTERPEGEFLEHTKRFTWALDVLVLPDARPGVKVLPFKLQMQVCDDRGCIPGSPEFEARIDVSDEPPVELTPQLRDRLDAKQRIEVVPVLGSIPPAMPNEAAKTDSSANPPSPSREKVETGDPSAAPQPETSDPADRQGDGILAFVLQGILWGAISLLTPCVFPMIPITVSFFLKKSEEQHHRPLTMAMVYSGTIVVVLTLGGLLLMNVLQPLSQKWYTNFILGGLFAVFALSLFGMFEIRLPTALANFTSAHEGQGGLVGTMFMALTFTVISFTCVAPFYGGFIALAASAASFSDWLRLVLGALSFSATFASPFFLLALFPSLLRSMPKSGSWMNTVKVVMGFLEIAAALKFLRAAELSFSGRADFLTYDLVLGFYVALSILCGLYLLNLYRLPHDHEPVEQLGVPRLMFSLIFLALGFYLAPALFKTDSGEKQRPTGTVFAWLDSFLLPDARPKTTEVVGSAGRPGGKSLQLTWTGSLEKGLKEAEDKHRLVFVNFTGLI
jgi:thiol:disulfide interchange protein DsbD